MQATRIINRTLVFIGLMIAFLALCAEFEQLNELQFVTAKIMAAAFGYAVIRLARILNAEGRL